MSKAGYEVELRETVTLIGLSDGEVMDWAAIGVCGHTSPFFTTKEAAERWVCPVCEERMTSERNARYLLDRLLLVLETPEDQQRLVVLLPAFQAMVKA